MNDAATATSHQSNTATGLIDRLDDVRESRRDQARSQLGVTGAEKVSRLRSILRENRLGWYPVAALGVLSIMDQLQGYAFTVLTPDMSRALGLSLGAIAGIRTLQALANALSPLPFAWLTQTRPRRALLSITTGIGWSMIAFGNGLVVNSWGLALVLVMDGILGGSVALHKPLLMDSYPPQARVRLVSAWMAFRISASIIGPLLIAITVSVFSLTWRGVFLVIGTVSMIGALFAAGLRDPGFGRWDTQRLRKSVRGDLLHENDDVLRKQTSLGFFEIIRRVMLIPTLRRLALGYLVFGILVVPYTTFLSFFLDERWGMDAGQRGWFFAFTSGVGVLALLLYGRRGERMFQQDPGKVLNFVGLLLIFGVVCIVLGAVVPVFAIMIAFFGLQNAVTSILFPALGVVQLSVVRAEWRAHISALIGVFVAAGSLAGLFLLVGVERDLGLTAAFVSLLVPGVIGGLLIRSAKDLAGNDLEQMIDEVVEEEEIRQVVDSGRHIPLLSCRKIDFYYGQLQVLFDVDFTVDEGELVVLLGTNGAGKSTLLKAISGVSLPTSGTIRYNGHDVTYLDAERRVRLGISQIPGGRATFESVSVTDNLRAFGYTLGRNRKTVDAAVERALGAFPRLYERRNSLARTLSGGERQMLGLSQALILEPRVLLIDELSLGLAPVIVTQLLDLVREINAKGTAVVLVEQSINIALSVARHAYFMEKGQIKFDGASNDLLSRGDLLRAVFLEGAAKGRPS